MSNQRKNPWLLGEGEDFVSPQPQIHALPASPTASPSYQGASSTGKLTSRRLTVSLPEPMAAELEQNAKQQGVSISEMVRRSIQNDSSITTVQANQLLPSNLPKASTVSSPSVLHLPFSENVDVHTGDKPASQRVTISLPQPLTDELSKIATIEGISVSAAARQSIRRDVSFQSLTNQGWQVVLKAPDGREYDAIPVKMRRLS